MTAGFVEAVDGVESFDLLSLGLDIGSSTTHLAVSRLVFRRQGSQLSSQFEVTAREVRYRSPIVLTPYATPDEIDVDTLAGLVDGFLGEAGVRPADIDNGLVVITGEALKKHNAEAISGWLATLLGDFTCVSAGAHHEAVLAAHGSGAVQHSRSTGTRGLCIDVGGGTAKLAVVDDGRVMSTGAFSVGGRLLAFDDDGTVIRHESAITPILAAAGVEAVMGRRLERADRERVARLMAETVAGFVAGTVDPELGVALRVTPPPLLPAVDQLDWMVFSGGVSEFVYADAPAQRTDDLGRDLGRGIREVFTQQGWWPLVRPPVERIRATVVGAGEYSLQVSGMTSYVSTLTALPLLGLEVIKATASSSDLARLPADLHAALQLRDRSAYDDGAAVALELDGRFRYPELRSVAETLVTLAAEGGGSPALTIVVEDDIARSLGVLLAEELRWPGPVTVLDGITVGDLDYMDVGRPVSLVGSIPVTVTSLLFPSAVSSQTADVGTRDTMHGRLRSST